MPSQRLLLDGPDLQALLRRAEEVGGRVLRAERVRRGLLGRWWYEVSVEVPDRAATESSPLVAARWARSAADRRAGSAPRAAAGRRPAGIGDLLAAAEAAERAEAASAQTARSAKGVRGR